MYCCEFENTKDGSLNFAPENILNRQLIFTRFLTPYQKKNYRWIEYDLKEDLSEDDIIRRFMNKFGNANPQKPIREIRWEEIKDAAEHIWHAWVIHEKDYEVLSKIFPNLEKASEVNQKMSSAFFKMAKKIK